MIACRKCGNCDEKKIRVDKHIFKNQTFHYKLLCFECGATYYCPRTKEYFKKANERDWVTEHGKGVTRQREKEFNLIRKALRKTSNKQLTII